MEPILLIERSQSADVDVNVEHPPTNAELERLSVRRKVGNHQYDLRGTVKCTLQNARLSAAIVTVLTFY